MVFSNKIYDFYLGLSQKHGSCEELWPQWCASRKTLRDREVILFGAILTQRTSWHNVEIALKNLKKADLLSLEKIASLKSLNYLTELIRPAGFYQSKPKRLFGLCSFIIKKYGSLEKMMKAETGTLRTELLSFSGIGPETTDVILLYVLDKLSFVIDEYTKRLVVKSKLADNLSYDFLQDLFQKSLPCDLTIYQNFHALIILEQRGKISAKMERV